MWHDAKCHDFSNMIEAALGLRKLSKFGWAKCELMINVINYCLSSFRIKYLSDICLKVFMANFWFLFSKENGILFQKKIEFTIFYVLTVLTGCARYSVNSQCCYKSVPLSMMVSSTSLQQKWPSTLCSRDVTTGAIDMLKCMFRKNELELWSWFNPAVFGSSEMFNWTEFQVILTKRTL